MRFRNIDEAIAWITTPQGRHHEFADFKKLCHELGDPQDRFYTIHVAGTDGKGSTVAYLRDLQM